jgi:pimeloyl-ACP methyl ester carboxylesterase
MPLTAALKVLLTILVVYCILVAIVFVLQRRMLYFPAVERPPADLVAAVGMAYWPSPTSDYRGLVSNEPAKASATVVVFHGNAGGAIDRSYYVRALAPLGYRVLLAEYPGYGGRSGKPSEAVLVADAVETVELAHEEFGGPVYLWGESLGAGVAAAVAANTETPIAGLVLVTPWDSLPDLAQYIYWFFPVRWLMLDQYNSVENVASYAGPVAVVVAERDEIIPARHSMNLFDAVPGNKRLWVLAGANHNSWPVQPDAAWWREVVSFITVAGE